MKTVYRRKRLYWITFLIVVGCIILLCFQFFSVHLLSPYTDDRRDGGRFARGARPRESDSENEALQIESDKQRYIERLHNGKAVPAMTETHPPVKCSSNCTHLGQDQEDQFQGHSKYLGRDLGRSQRQDQDKNLGQDQVQGYRKKNQDHDIVRGETKSNVPEVLNTSQGSLNLEIKEKRPPPHIVTWDALEEHFKGMWRGEHPQPPQYVHGIHPAWIHLYQDFPSQGIFTCLFSKEEIWMSRVNDDYCDCRDSTDEPGTAACPDSRFYCTFQRMQQYHWLPSSRVSDGLCDCCDGSDEWKIGRVADRIHIQEMQIQALCKDSCWQLRAKEDELKQQLKEGAIIRQKYISEGSKYPNPDMIYGLDSEFYPLSRRCFKLDVGSRYQYEICPFVAVKQTVRHGQEGAGTEVIIGRGGKWSNYAIGRQSIGGRAKLLLNMDEGHGLNCPDGKSRNTVIEFVCGIKDKVESISESEICSYMVLFKTPAACLNHL